MTRSPGPRVVPAPCWAPDCPFEGTETRTVHNEETVQLCFDHGEQWDAKVAQALRNMQIKARAAWPEMPKASGE